MAKRRVQLSDINWGTIQSGSAAGRASFLAINNRGDVIIDEAGSAGGGAGDMTGVDLTGGTGIDISSETNTTSGDYSATIAVDVSDFMTNGSDNRVVTATGTDAMNAEASLVFDGTSLGIGTASPGTLLQLEGTAPYITLKNSTSENTDGGCESKIIFEDHANTALAQIQGSHDGTSDDTKGDLIFSTHNNSSLTERMRIESDGLVSIKNGPDPDSHSAGAGSVHIMSHNSHMNGAEGIPAGGIIIGEKAYVNGNEYHIAIDADKIQCWHMHSNGTVKNSAYNVLKLQYHGGDIRMGASNTYLYYSYSLDNWGVKTATPQYDFDVSGDLKGSQIYSTNHITIETGGVFTPTINLKNDTSENTDGGCESLIKFKDHSDAVLAQIQGSHDGSSDDTKGDLIFSTNNGSSLTEVMRVDSGGKVNITNAIDDGSTNRTLLSLFNNRSDDCDSYDWAPTSIDFDIQNGSGQYGGIARIGAVLCPTGGSAHDTAAGEQSTGLTFSTQNNTTLSEAMRINAEGKVGIHTNNPASMLHIKQDTDPSYNGTTITHFGSALRLEEASSDESIWTIMVGGRIWNGFAHVASSHNLWFGYNASGSADATTSTAQGYLANNDDAWTLINFTGQHRSLPHSGSAQDYSESTGLIVVATGDYSNPDSDEKITINDATPIVELSNSRNNKRVFGVISELEDVNDGMRKLSAGNFVSVREATDPGRLFINSLGEGAIWICNINGNMENGDYITTCEVPGFGMKQDDDLLHNYTVAKITCDCDFDLSSSEYVCEEFEFQGNTYRKAFVGCTYHCG